MATNLCLLPDTGLQPRTPQARTAASGLFCVCLGQDQVRRLADMLAGPIVHRTMDHRMHCLEEHLT